MARKGIRITRDSYRAVVPAFVMWLDKTYPHLTGLISIEWEGKGEPKFAYRSFDGQKLSPQDKELIKHAWKRCMEKAHYLMSTKEVKDDAPLPKKAQQAIASIQGGYYSDAVRCLLHLMEDRIGRCIEDEAKAYKMGVVDGMKNGVKCTCDDGNKAEGPKEDNF